MKLNVAGNPAKVLSAKGSTGYVNRTDYPFYFNRDREPPEVEATYTLFLYEDLHAIKRACSELGIRERKHVQAILHDNAARLIAGILARKEGIGCKAYV